MVAKIVNCGVLKKRGKKAEDRNCLGCGLKCHNSDVSKECV